MGTPSLIGANMPDKLDNHRQMTNVWYQNRPFLSDMTTWWIQPDLNVWLAWGPIHLKNFPPDKWPCPDLHIPEKFLSRGTSISPSPTRTGHFVRPATGLFSKMIQTCPTWQQTFIHCMLPLSFLTFLFELGSNMGDGIDCVDIWTSDRGGIRILISRGGFREKIIINQK